uniref:Uncharacterized protein n=1 Tax=Oreochromis niloticus TaxID=8128 RepID=A0A669F4T8_ORENI
MDVRPGEHFVLFKCLCCRHSDTLFLSAPYHRCGVIRKGARRVRELGEARVNLVHWVDARYQQLSHLFL